jgi:hypothetical protein
VQERVFEHQKQKEKFRNNGAELNTESDNRNKSAGAKKDLQNKMKTIHTACWKINSFKDEWKTASCKDPVGTAL